MNIKEETDKKDKAGCKDFRPPFKDSQEVFEKMRKCCTGQEGSIDCCAMMDGMMKKMITGGY